MEGGAMRRHAEHELRLGSFADGQAVEPPDTALVGRYCTGQDHPDDGGDQIRLTIDGGHSPAVTGRNDRRARSA
jgi:hypothetical protein